MLVNQSIFSVLVKADAPPDVKHTTPRRSVEDALTHPRQLRWIAQDLC